MSIVDRAGVYVMRFGYALGGPSRWPRLLPARVEHHVVRGVPPVLGACLR